MNFPLIRCLTIPSPLKTACKYFRRIPKHIMLHVIDTAPIPDPLYYVPNLATAEKALEDIMMGHF